MIDNDEFERGRRAALADAAAVLRMDDQDIRLLAGELTADEMRAVRAVLSFVRHRIAGLVE